MNEPNDEIEVEVRGMTCDSCAAHVTRALEGVSGVQNVRVPGWQSGRASLVASLAVADEALRDAVRQAGYQVVSIKRQLRAGRTAAASIPDADFDLAVIGTGGGGMGAAIKAAELGKRVCLIEAGVIGGTCVNIGCVPSKTLIRAAAAYHSAGHPSFAGVHTSASGVDWPTVIAQKDNLVGELRQNKYEDVIASYGEHITLARSRARLRPDGAVAFEDGNVCRASRVVIATGARPAILPLDGIDRVPVLDSTSAMALESQPRSLIIIGGRAVALELGQAFARFGTQVTILQRSARLIPEHEPEIADELAAALREEGLVIHTGAQPRAIRQDNGEKVILADVNGVPAEFRAEQVLMAVGRTPNTGNMGLEDAGVKLDARGFIVVDDMMQTSNPMIYAVGDVTTLPKLVYVAAMAGGIAAQNALGEDEKRLDLTVLPDVIFTDPQAATVGLTEAAARERGYEVQVSQLPMAYVPRALAARDTRGIIKLIADKDSGRLLGAHVLAAEAGEVIQTAALAVRFGLRFGFSVNDLSEMLFPYLTQSEGLKLAAIAFKKDVAQLSCCAN